MNMENQNNIEDAIMQEINSGRVKPRPKFVFLAEKIGVSGVLALSIIIAVLFCCLVVFYFGASENLYYLSFGSSGLWAFLESFPLLLIVGLLLLITSACLIIKKAGMLYKKPFGVVIIVTVFSIVLGGCALALTDFAEKIESGTKFLQPANFMNRHKGVAGKVTHVGEQLLIIKTPHGERVINTSNLKIKPQAQLSVGVFIIAAGSGDQQKFDACCVKVLGERDAPAMMRKEIYTQVNIAE